MKKINLLLLLVAILLAGCQQKAEKETVDLDAARAELEALSDSYYDAWEMRDIEMLEGMIADWGLYAGTDPKEFWNKEQILDLWKRFFANPDATLDYTPIGRNINVSPCGMTAVIVNQGTHNKWSPNIPVRLTFHALKMGESWQIVFINWSFVFKNEDVKRLNAALDQDPSA
jgi:hypothetical protein